MSEPDKNGGNLPHAVFRNADALADRARAEHRKVDVSAKWLDFAREVFDWIKKQFTKE